MKISAKALANDTLATADFEIAKVKEKAKAGMIDSAIPSGPPIASSKDCLEIVGPFSV